MPKDVYTKTSVFKKALGPTKLLLANSAAYNYLEAFQVYF